MTFCNSIAALLLALAMASVSVGANAQQQANPVKLQLDYDGGSCTFVTDDGVTINNPTADTIKASGEFGAGCSVGGGGATGPASVSVTTNHATREVGESATITWSANADVCSYDGSTLPEAVPQWKSSGYACTDSSSCTGGSFSHTFNTAGVYNFKLTCNSGPNDSKTSTATVTVGDPPSNDTCVAPAGLTRDQTGTIAYSSGVNQETVDVTSWQAVYGHRTGMPDLGWPGYFNRDVKMTIKKNHYWALKFKVGDLYPFYGTWGGTVGPYGTWESNATNVTYGVKWTLSISPQCGDFVRPAAPDPRRACYAEYTITTANELLWLVADGSTNPLAYACTLRRGQSYYLNILPAPLGDPLNNTGAGCNQSSCQGNFAHKGNYDGTQGM